MTPSQRTHASKFLSLVLRHQPTIRAGDMQRAGFTFYLTPNHVWLTDHVPAQYLVFPDVS